ncbi:MAG: TatD family hydrolase [Patescibacteria group bacterium]
MFKFFDAHSHIHEKEFSADRADVLARMRAAETGTITVGTHLESSRAAVELAREEEGVWATVGLHPTDTKEIFDEKLYAALAAEPKVVAIGECGLDYFRGGTDEGDKKRQEKEFSAQIEFAMKLGKPLMIHGRPSKGSMDAYRDILDILGHYKNESGIFGDIHFFSGDKETARKFLDLGFTLSFTGVVTFTSDYDEVVRYTPLDSILSETDCPYAAPLPYRGKRNEPSFISIISDRIAAIKGEDKNRVSKALVDNAYRVFGLN